jgi:hypothetical protein
VGGLAGIWKGLGSAPGLAVEHDAVGAVTQSINRRRAQQLVRERRPPFVKVQI